MKKRKWMILTAALCLSVGMTACGDNVKESDEKDLSYSVESEKSVGSEAGITVPDETNTPVETPGAGTGETGEKEADLSEEKEEAADTDGLVPETGAASETNERPESTVKPAAVGQDPDQDAIGTAATKKPTATKKPSKKPAKKPAATKKPKKTKKPAATKKPSKKAYKASAVLEASLKGLDLPSMVDMTDDMMADTYGIDKKLLSSYAVKMPMMVVHATECSVFVVKDKDSVKDVKKGIKKRVEALKDTWSQYLPDQYDLVENYKVKVVGRYVLFVIAEDTDTIVKNFKAYVK